MGQAEDNRTLSERIMQTGSSQEEPLKTILNAGNLKMIWTGRNLRYISSGDQELLRMIYPAVRDRDWQTIVPVITSDRLQNQEDSFLIRQTCHYRKGEIDFIAEYTIEGTNDSAITLIMEGTALSGFEKNRIGWCVLHPIEGNAGEKCLVELKNGMTEQSTFPSDISPFQIFTNIKSLTWTRQEISCRIEFEGDLFETEDERNWTDASFKTYSTPLSLPYPVRIEKGTRIYQRVKLSVTGNFNPRPVKDPRILVRLFPDETYRIPEIGICRKSGSRSSLTENEIRVIRNLKFDHYRVDIHLHIQGWQEEAGKGTSESHDLGFPVEIALFFSDNYDRELKSFISWFTDLKIIISSILLYHIEIPMIPDERSRDIIRTLREIDPQINISTGTNGNFAQLNRKRPGDSRNDSVCFSINPQEHLTDSITLVENLKAQAYAVISAKKFSGNKKITVSPVTLKSRFNTRKIMFEALSDDDLSSRVDSRQMSLFGACWTAISIKYLGESGADSITYFETTGERGIVQGENESGWPESFHAYCGMIFPAYHVFRYVLGNKNMTGIKCISSSPLDVDCLAMSDGKQARIILVNFTDSVRTVMMECCSGLFRIRSLSARCFGEAAANMRWTGMEKEKVMKSQNAFEIEPYSVNFIEGWRKH